MEEIKIVTQMGNVNIIAHESQSSEIVNVIRDRASIAADYCKNKGWPLIPSELSFEQILEIRDLKEWKDAIK